MRGSKIDIGKFGIVKSASFSIWVIGGGEFFEVAIGVGPCVDADCEHENGQSKEEDAAVPICA